MTAVASAAALVEMRFLADHDPLTRLGNRRAFTARLAEVAHSGARYDRPFGLVVLDVDGFKALNDAHGHLVGDTVLEAIGDVLRRTLRSLGHRLPPGRRRVRPDPRRGRGARRRARRRAHRRRDRRDRRRRRIAAGVFGIALGTEAPDPEQLLRAADAAMYEAKRAGDGVRFAVPEPPPAPIG